MQEEIKNMLGELLELDEGSVGVLTGDADLIELGLDSLKAIELVVHIEDNFGIMISDDDLLVDNLSSIEKIESLIATYQDN